MATTDTQICNLALSRIAEKPIMSMADNSAPARACLLWYEATRDEVLRAHRWNFAKKSATLSELATAPAFGWTHQYQLPIDCLRVWQLNGFEDWQEPRPWEIEGRLLLTHQEVAEIKYVYRNTNEHEYDALFVMAFAAKLAAAIAPSVCGPATSIGGAQLQQYQQLLAPLARKTDANESRRKIRLPWMESPLVKSRFADILTVGYDYGSQG
jgi:hypothetical protein